LLDLDGYRFDNLFFSAVPMSINRIIYVLQYLYTVGWVTIRAFCQ